MLTVIIEYTDNPDQQNARVIIPNRSENSVTLYYEVLRTCAAGTVTGSVDNNNNFVISSNSNQVSSKDFSKKLSTAIETLELGKEFQFVYKEKAHDSIFTVEVNEQDIIIGFPKSVEPTRVKTLCEAIEDYRYPLSKTKLIEKKPTIDKDNFTYAHFIVQGEPIEITSLFKRKIAAFLTEINSKYDAQNQVAQRAMEQQEAKTISEQPAQKKPKNGVEKGSILKRIKQRLKPW